MTRSEHGACDRFVRKWRPDRLIRSLGRHHMRITRLFGAAVAATIAAIAPLSATIASAEEVQGVGTGNVSATVLQVDVGANGSVLSVRVLSDDSTSNTDPANGAPS